MKKKIIALCLCVVMLTVAIVGGSLAYFTDNDAADNTFTMGNVKIKLDEAPVTKEGSEWIADPDAQRVQENNYETLYPGAVLPKDPVVHNVGANPAYIRATVNVSNWMNICSTIDPAAPAYGAEGYEQTLLKLIDALGEGWSIIGVEGGDTFTIGQFDAKFILKYAPVLAPGADTTPIFTKVNVPTEFESGYDYLFNEIKIEAQAVQSESFETWEAAFAAVEPKA